MAVAAFALASDTPVYGLGEKGGSLNKRGQLVSSGVEDALGVNTDLSYKNTPFAWAITPNGCWGVLTHTTVDVMHGVGYAQWSNRSYAVVSNEPELDLFHCRRYASRRALAAYHRLTGKPENVPLWSLGAWISRAYYRDEADIMATANETRTPLPSRRHHLRRPRLAGHADPLSLQLRPVALSRSGVSSTSSALTTRFAAGVSARPGQSSRVPQTYQQQGYFLKRSDGSELVFEWDRARRPRHSAQR